MGRQAQIDGVVRSQIARSLRDQSVLEILGRTYYRDAQ